MRSRKRIVDDMIRAAEPSEPDKHLLRLLKTELLNAELLMDIRDVLVDLYNRESDVKIEYKNDE